MKGDFSKIPRSKRQEREDNYNRVLFQQGRVLTDADWNEQAAIHDSNDSTSLTDIIGKNGIPIEEKDSFKITPNPKGGNSFTIGKGRIYVDGRLVENFIEVGNYAFSDGTDKAVGQPYLPSSTIEGQPTSDAIPKVPGKYLAYLKVFDRHITYIEDSDIQESALGGADTSTRVQTVWQVLLHKLEDDDVTGGSPNEENKWAPWIPLGANNNDLQATDIKIGTNNDGSLLEVFATTKVDRMSIREVRLDPVEWETNWDLAQDSFGSDEFDIASRQVDNLEILHTFKIEYFHNKFNYFIRDDNTSRWGQEKAAPPGEGKPGVEINQIKLVMNAKNILYVFAFWPEKEGIFYNIQENSSWGDWKEVPGGDIEKFSVILNPTNNCIEIYSVNSDSQIFYTKQEKPNLENWTEWKQINPNEPSHFKDISIGLNRKNQVVIFAKDVDGKLSSTVKEETDSVGNGWRRVGTNDPGKLISHPRWLSVQRNPNPDKEDRLEVFGIFSIENSAHGFGKLWNISEDEDGKWESDWEIINENPMLKAVASTTDAKSRLNLFVIDGETGIVHHSYLDYRKELSCQSEIPSWESKIKPSTCQLKARARPQAPQPNDPCMLPEQAGYRSLENQLYRIEIHDPISAGKNATFKFSQDNGTLHSKILDISGNKITVASIGRDDLLRFKVDDWIEIKNNLLELWEKPGVLVHIIKIEDTELTFEEKIPANAEIDKIIIPELNPTARKWDSKPTITVEIPPANDGWINIKDGIEVKFKNVDNSVDTCRTGDYFTIPARTLKADIEWPKGPDGLPEFVDIEGINYHYAKLALLEYTGTELKQISDCRPFFLFPPLNSLKNLDAPSETKYLECWVHGTIAEIEFPERVIPVPFVPPQGFKHGGGSSYFRRVKDDQDNLLPAWNWIHFPLTISTPIDPGKTMSLKEIYVLFHSSGAKITDIFIYEGGFIRKKFENLILDGGDPSFRDESNTFRLHDELILSKGLGITMRFEFTQLDGQINFNTVGARLKVKNETCADCFTTVLNQKELNDFIRSLRDNTLLSSLEAVCDLLTTFLDEKQNREAWSAFLFSMGKTIGISIDKINKILDNQEVLYGGVFPRHIEGSSLKSLGMTWKNILKQLR